MKYPISPEYIQAASESLTPLYNDLEDYIIQKICEQLKETGQANATTLELIRQLQRRGLDLKEIEKRIRTTLRFSNARMDAIFADAAERNAVYCGTVLDKVGLVGEAYRAAEMRLEAEAIARQTTGAFDNLSQSMGFALRGPDGSVQFQPIADAYQTILNKAVIRVQSSAVGYNVAIREAVKELTDSGIQVIDYESGHRDRADVAARRAIMTGVGQISSLYTDQLAEELNTPYREVSAHSGARDTGTGWQDHKSWQGKVYSLNAGDIYPSIYAVCGLGQVDGLQGANCRHRCFPWIEGVSERTYTDAELRNIDPPPFTYQGNQYTIYEATQQQRKLERALRSVKRRMIGEKAASLEDEYKSDAARYRALSEEYDKFSKAAGLRPQKERSFIAEFGPKEAREAMKAATE